MRKILVVVCLLVIMAGMTLAQDEPCDVLVQEALTRTEAVCSETGRNQVCYGHLAIEAEAQPDVENFIFSQSGDIVDIQDLSSMQLSSMGLDEIETWGVALMRIQANIPDTLPGQNVTMLLFGNVNFEPNTDSVGMQGFYVNTGLGQPMCQSAPEDGILLQTPSGVDEVTMQINDTQLVIGSTAFIQVRPDENIAVMMLEGQGEVTAQNETVEVPAGAWVNVPVDVYGDSMGVPELRAYEMERVQNLPVHMMPDGIDIAPSMTEDDMAAWLAKPSEGDWYSQIIEACPDTRVSRAFYTLSNSDGKGFDLQPSGSENVIHYRMREPGIYINAFGAEWTVIDAQTIESRVVYTDGCVSLSRLTHS